MRTWTPRLVACLFFATPSTASAQADTLLADIVRLRAGFAPDPYTTDVIAAGFIKSSFCPAGWVRENSDPMLDFDGGSDLYIYAVGDKDITLEVAVAAAGSDSYDRYCDDDGLGGTDPLVALHGLSRSLILVDVGTSEEMVAANAKVYVSRTDPRGSAPVALPAIEGGELSMSGEAEAAIDAVRRDLRATGFQILAERRRLIDDDFILGRVNVGTTLESGWEYRVVAVADGCGRSCGDGLILMTNEWVMNTARETVGDLTTGTASWPGDAGQRVTFTARIQNAATEYPVHVLLARRSGVRPAGDP